MPLPRGYRYTHCRRGHPFDAANTYVRPDTGRQNCRLCARERQRERRAATKCPRCYGTGKVLLRDTDGRLERSLVPCPLCVAERSEATPTDDICLVCGAKEPCMTEADLKPGDPGVPCTFDRDRPK